MPSPRQSALLVLFLLSAPTCLAAQQRPAIDPAQVLERFQVAPHGDALVIPVTVEGKRQLFLIDTASDFTVFDKKLLRGEPKDEVWTQTPSGKTLIKLYDAPELHLGKIRRRFDRPAAGLDMQKLREVIGHDIHGVLGMDFLGKHILHINFDDGELLFLKSADPKAGQAFPLDYRHGGRSPRVALEIPGWGKELFAVDTGHGGYSSLDVSSAFFDILVLQKVVQVARETNATTATDTRKSRIGRAANVTLGDVKVSRVLVGENGIGNLLGLEFLSRFHVTLDFPGAKMYLQRGKRFAEPDRYDLSGLHILRRGGQVVVESADKDSAADKAGVRGGDILVRVGKADLKEMGLVAVRKLFCVEDQTISLTIRRGERTLDLRLPLKKTSAD